METTGLIQRRRSSDENTQQPLTRGSRGSRSSVDESPRIHLDSSPTQRSLLLSDENEMKCESQEPSEGSQSKHKPHHGHPHHLSSKKKKMIPDYYQTNSNILWWFCLLNACWVVFGGYCVMSGITNYIWMILSMPQRKLQAFVRSENSHPFVVSLLQRLHRRRAGRHLESGWIPSFVISYLSGLPNMIPGLCLGMYPSPIINRDQSVIDLSDSQYREWRGGLLMQSLFFISFAIVSRLLVPNITRLFNGRIRESTVRIWHSIFYGLGFALVIHGLGGLILQLLILFINFLISRMLFVRNNNNNEWIRSLSVWLTWIFNLIIVIYTSLADPSDLTLNAWFKIIPGLFISESWAEWRPIPGIEIPWYSFQRFMLLKCVSFNLDCLFTLNAYSSANNTNTQNNNNKNDHITGFFLRIPGYHRKMSSLYQSKHSLIDLDPYSDFSFVCFLAYAYYPPLYFAGPIISFHDFLCQFRKSQRVPILNQKNQSSNAHGSWFSFHHSLLDRDFVIYVIRFFVSFLTLEITLHFVFFGLLKSYLFESGDFVRGLRKMVLSGDDSIGDSKILWLFAMSVPVYAMWHVAFFVYLKFNSLWKYYRLMAKLEGLDTVENMQRCVTHSESVKVFWQAWHSSFNRWNVRYLLIPLKSRESSGLVQSAVVLGVFVFTAGWHGDFTLSLAGWGLIMALASIAEYLGSRWMKIGNKATQSAAAVLATLVLILANHSGFGSGLESTGLLYRTFLGNAVSGSNWRVQAQTVYLLGSLYGLSFGVLLHQTWLYSRHPNTHLCRS